MEVRAVEKTLPFPKLGSKLSVFDDFIARCGGREALVDKTTTEVCEQFLKPMTAASGGQSYCDFLIAEGRCAGAVQKATVFISHAWKFQFLDVVNAILFHFKSSPDVVVWFDMFSNNQHAAVELPFYWWETTFREAIGDFKHTVMVLTPWDNPIPLTRAWCLFEVFQTVATNSRFEVAMSESETKRFLEQLDTTSYMKMLSNIDLEKSEAFMADDKRRIFKVVQDGVGFHGLNTMVLEVLRGWVQKQAQDALAHRDDVGAKLKLANLYKDQGQYDKAEGLYIESLERRRSMLGEDHPDTLDSINCLAVLYSEQGRYGKAEELYIECLMKRRATLGEDHPDTLSSINGLAVLYYRQGRGAYDKAEELYVECLEKRRAKLGDDHPETMNTINGLANLYKDQGRYDEAEKLYVECLESRRAKLGGDHPDTLMSINGLASIYCEQQRYDMAEVLYIECLEKRRAKLGNDHPKTLWSINNLAALYRREGRYDKAEELFVECLELRKAKLGEDHPYTLNSTSSLAAVFSDQGRCDKAEELFSECLEKRRVKLGSDHPDTLQTIVDLAGVLADSGKRPQAEALYAEGITKGVATLGSDHDSVTQWKESYHKHMGVVYP